MSGKYTLHGVPMTLLPYQKRHCPMFTHRSFLNLYSTRQPYQNGHTRVCACAGCGWDKVNSHHSSLCVTLLSFVANNVGNTPVFFPLLISAYTVSRLSLCLTLALPSFPKNDAGDKKENGSTTVGQLI